MDIESNLNLIYSTLQSGNLDEAFVLHNKLLNNTDNMSLENLAEIDMVYARLLLELGEFEKVYQMMVNLFEDKNKMKSEAFRLSIDIYYAISQAFTGRIAEAAESVKKIEAIIPKMQKINVKNSKVLFSELHNLKGVIAFRNGFEEKAISEYELSIKLSKEMNHRKDEGRTIFNLGSLYQHKGDSNSAITSYSRSLEIFEGIRFYEGIMPCLTRLKNIYENLNDTDAIYVYQQRIMDFNVFMELRKCKISSSRMDFELNNQIIDLVAERNELEQKIWNLEFTINSSNDPLVNSLTSQIERKATEENTKLKEELEQIAKDQEVLLVELENTQNEKDEILSQIEEREKKFGELEASYKTQIEMYKRRIEEMEHISTDDEDDMIVEQLQAEIKAGNEIISEMTNNIKKFEEENDSLKKEIEKIKQENDENAKALVETQFADSKSDSYIEKITNLENEIAIIKDENLKQKEKYKNEIEVLTTDKKENNAEIDELQDRVRKLESDLENKIKERPGDPVPKVVEPLEIQALNDEIKTLNEKIAKMDDETAKSSERQMETLTTLEEKIKTLESENDELKVNIDSNENIDQLKKDLKYLEQKNEALSAQIEEYEDKASKIKDLELEIKRATNEYSNLENEFEDYKKNYNADLSEQLIKKDKDITDLRVKIANLTRDEVSESPQIEFDQLPTDPKDLAKLTFDERKDDYQMPAPVEIEGSPIIVKSGKITTKVEPVSQTVKPSEILKQQDKPKKVKKVDIDENVAKITHKSLETSQDTLEEYLESDKLAENLFTMIEGSGKMQLRFLAMRLGVSPNKCMDVIENLERLSAVRITYSEGNENNPLITLKT